MPCKVFWIPFQKYLPSQKTVGPFALISWKACPNTTRDQLEACKLKAFLLNHSLAVFHASLRHLWLVQWKSSLFDFGTCLALHLLICMLFCFSSLGEEKKKNMLSGHTRSDVSILQGELVPRGIMRLKTHRLNKGLWLCYTQLWN